MVRSMTGFGRGECTSAAGVHVVAEVKTVNNRFFDLVFRAPKALLAFEERLRPVVQDGLGRGRVDVSLSMEELGQRSKAVKVDIALARGHLQAVQQLRDALGFTGDPPLELILKLPDVVSVADAPVDQEDLFAAASLAVGQAVAGAIAMRESEGTRLVRDIGERLEIIRQTTGEIGERAPEVVEGYRTRLTQRVQELLSDATSVDQGRLALEIAVFADRSNITEELVRLESHLDEARLTLRGGDGAVGRKLEFLLQEMNREINTIGSKANDVVIARRVIDVKAELEKIREQLQNIE